MSDLLLNILLAALAISVLVSVWRFHNSEFYSHFNLIDLVTNGEGKAHRPAVMELGAWVLMSWGFVMLINRNSLTEWYAGIYVGAFVIRGAWASYLGSKQSLAETPKPKDLS